MSFCYLLENLNQLILNNVQPILSFVKDLIPALATLFAAYFGAKYAFKLNSSQRKAELKNKEVVAGQMALFQLFKMINTIGLYRKDFVEPVRKQKDYVFALRPTHSDPLDQFQINFDSLGFLLNTAHKQVLLDLFLEQQRFNEFLKCVDYRSELHATKFQTLLPDLVKHANAEGEVDIATLITAVGPLIHHQLTSATDNIIKLVDDSVVSLSAIKDGLYTALKSLYPDANFLQFGLDEPD